MYIFIGKVYAYNSVPTYYIHYKTGIKRHERLEQKCVNKSPHVFLFIHTSEMNALTQLFSSQLFFDLSFGLFFFFNKTYVPALGKNWNAN